MKPGDKSGEFKRQTSSFRNFISKEPGAEFPAEKGRYHIYISYACPWVRPHLTLHLPPIQNLTSYQATRTIIARKLKGLESFITVSCVHWYLGEKGWRFPTPSDTDAEGEDVIPDPVPGHEDFTHLRDLYFQSQPDFNGRFTVPVLYDKIQQRIVNNESSEILRMLNTEFNHLLDDAHAQVDLYPEPLRKQIDEANEWQYDTINNGVYKSGFATTQEAYDKAVHALFSSLDRADEHLAKSEGPYWFGDRLTEVDIRLYVTIIRFDPVYVQHFKCNIRDIRSGYPALHKWVRNLYWNVPAFKETTNFLHIKNHYTRSHKQINHFSITPAGPVPDIFPLDEEVPAARK